MQLINEQGIGKNIAVVTATDSDYGLILVPQLNDLPPGMNGFHIHQKPDCGNVVQGNKPGTRFAKGDTLALLKQINMKDPMGKDTWEISLPYVMVRMARHPCPY